ncbi:hypothetical protein RR48_15120 [Papilio machaon]|uniref:Uncharacterized protein n=1 Tax=Papilio machaon TaxID=76193 RepID=A0A194QUH7_PAPMA|nr:hypothetical protein RR48_15120 [Papilio machaon]
MDSAESESVESSGCWLDGPGPSLFRFLLGIPISDNIKKNTDMFSPDALEAILAGTLSDMELSSDDEEPFRFTSERELQSVRVGADVINQNQREVFPPDSDEDEGPSSSWIGTNDPGVTDTCEWFSKHATLHPDVELQEAQDLRVDSEDSPQPQAPVRFVLRAEELRSHN